MCAARHDYRGVEEAVRQVAQAARDKLLEVERLQAADHLAKHAADLKRLEETYTALLAQLQQQEKQTLVRRLKGCCSCRGGGAPVERKEPLLCRTVAFHITLWAMAAFVDS